MMRKPLIPELNTAIDSAYRRINPNTKLAFYSSVVIGFLIHFFVLTNKFVNRDELMGLFSSNDRTISGRFLISTLRDLFSNYSLPFVNGLVTILALSAVAALCVSILKIRRPVYATLIGAAVLSFPSVSNFFSYLHTVDANAVGLLVGVAGAYCLDRYRWGFLPAAVLFSLSLGTYQANICLIGALMATRGLQLLLFGEKTNREILICIVQYVLAFGLGAALYSVINQLFLRIYQLELTTYMGVSDARIESFGELIHLFQKSYSRYFRFLLRDAVFLTSRFILMAHAGILVMSAVLFIVGLFQKRRAVLQWVLAVAVLLLLPAAYNSISLFKPATIHYLMLLSISFTYILPLVLLDGIEIKETKAAQRISGVSKMLIVAAVLLCVCLWSIYANQGYMVLKLKYENTYAFLNRVTDSIETHPDYRKGGQIAFVGRAENGNYPPTKAEYLQSFYSGMGFGNEQDYGFINDDLHIKYFIRYYIGVYFALIDDELEASLKEDPRIEAMACYPESGSMMLVDDTLVVKLGDIS